MDKINIKNNVNKNKRNREGITMITLVVVIIVIFVIAAVSITTVLNTDTNSLIGSKNKAENAYTTSDLISVVGTTTLNYVQLKKNKSPENITAYINGLNAEYVEILKQIGDKYKYGGFELEKIELVRTEGMGPEDLDFSDFIVCTNKEGDQFTLTSFEDITGEKLNYLTTNNPNTFDYVTEP